ncbi:hypothetical protein FBY37_0029 [Streptomyces sp. SLBN-134]|nr:hypothetical protein FBY37_0029 [Streptomyces sp. SLBN-134]
MLTALNEDNTTPSGGSLLEEILRQGPLRMPTAALEAEGNAHPAALADVRDAKGRRLVVRNGYHRPRQVTTAADVVEVKAPRVNGKRVNEQTGGHKRFSSALSPSRRGAASHRRSARRCRSAVALADRVGCRCR